MELRFNTTGGKPAVLKFFFIFSCPKSLFSNYFPEEQLQKSVHFFGRNSVTLVTEFCQNQDSQNLKIMHGTFQRRIANG